MPHLILGIQNLYLPRAWPQLHLERKSLQIRFQIKGEGIMSRFGLEKPIVVLGTTYFQRGPILWQLGGKTCPVGGDGHAKESFGHNQGNKETFVKLLVDAQSSRWPTSLQGAALCGVLCT